MNTQARQLVKSAILAAKTMDPSLELSLQDVLYLCKGKPPQHKIDKEPPLLLTQAGAARRLGCSRFTIRNLVIDGVLQPVRLRKSLWYRSSDIDRLARESEAGLGAVTKRDTKQEG